MAKENNVKSDITFNDCLESVRYEIEDALARFPANKDLFIHQVRLFLDKCQEQAKLEPGGSAP